MTKGEKFAALLIGIFLFAGLGFAIYDSLYSPAHMGNVGEYEDNLIPDQLDLENDEEELSADDEGTPPPPDPTEQSPANAGPVDKKTENKPPVKK